MCHAHALIYYQITFVYLESLDYYCHSCGMISLDDDMTDMVRSSYANKFVFVCGFHRSGAIVAHQGYGTMNGIYEDMWLHQAR